MEVLKVEDDLASIGDDLLHPPVLGVGRHVEGAMTVLAHIRDTRCDVVALGLEHAGQIETEGRLVARPS